MMVLSSGLSAIPSALGLPRFSETLEKRAPPGNEPRPVLWRHVGDGRLVQGGSEALPGPLLHRLLALVQAAHGEGRPLVQVTTHVEELMGAGCSSPLWLELRAELTMLSSSCCSIRSAACGRSAPEHARWGDMGSVRVVR